jgi:transketolase
VHGAALGAEEIARRAKPGWTWEPFVIPQEVYAAGTRRPPARAEGEWNERSRSTAEVPGRSRRIRAPHGRQAAGRLGREGCAIVAGANQRKETVATRKASQQAIEGLAAALPELLGGSADLTGSNLTNWKASKAVRAPRKARASLGNHINYGVREFGMSAAINGIALHGGYKPFGGTFLTFSDYSRNALRVAALMKCRRSSCSRTTRSASAKTARRTSRSNTSRACA